MFERRLKIFLVLLFVMTLFLLGRAAQLQLLQGQSWRDEAARMMRRFQPIETTRGAILDRNGAALAVDEPCTDACVDYRAVLDKPDPAWVKQQAEARLHARLDTISDKSQRTKITAPMVAAEEKAVLDDIERMWMVLAAVSGKTPDDIDEIRRGILRKVELRRRYLWWKNYQNSALHHDAQTDKEWYDRLFSQDGGNGPDVDQFALDVAEQTQPHVVLHAIDAETESKLARRLDRYPGLVLLSSKHRVYPFGRVACHVLGRLAMVGPEEFGKDAPFADDELRRYWPNDPIGRGGIEGLCEQVLRGSRGQVERDGVTDQIISSTDAVPGRDVRLSIDIELESDIEAALVKKRVFHLTDGDETRENQHGAAVVIDIASGQVLALVSNPGFNPNTLDSDYATLVSDEINKPLINRATQMALEPGSSVKTVVGCGSITDGVMTPQSTIECTGYLVLDGHEYSVGRCWIAAQFESQLGKLGVRHHSQPWTDPHPTGFLTVSDALERSCNVVFETIADRMGMPELCKWFDKFGLGRPTGIGIEESRGMIPDGMMAPRSSAGRLWTCFAGIGQGMVHTTPIQMCNVAATIARDGIWMRPRLVDDADVAPSAARGGNAAIPDRVDLGISPEALAAVKTGMIWVTEKGAGTGRGIRADEPDNLQPNDPLVSIVIAGKTGTAQAAMLTVPVRDEKGELVKDEHGRYLHQVVPLGTPGTEGWYVGVGKNNDRPAHAWYIGFAPAQHPQVAFCVMVEYGGAGGRVAGAVAHDVLVACVRHGYLSAGGQ